MRQQIYNMRFSRRLTLLILAICAALQLQAQILQPVTWDVKMEMKDNNTAELVFDATIEKGWHIYDVSVPADGPIATGVSWDMTRLKNVVLVGKLTPDKKAEEQVDLFFNLILGTWEKSVTLRQKVKILDPKNYNIEGAIIAQACNSETCQRSKKEFKYTVSTPVNAEAADTAKMVVTSSAPVEKQTATVEKSDYWKPIEVAPAVQIANKSFWYIFLGGFLGGLLALLTPCVWPMIPLTVSFFLKRSGNRKKAVVQALLYGLSIIVIYLILGLIITAIFGPHIHNQLATSAAFNIAFFVLLVVFAISFLGVFEITIPSKFTNSINTKAAKTSGLISLFFMAFTLVLVSFSCTGPIIGTLLVDAVTSGSTIGPAVGMFGFALALSIPFTLFAIFPSWLKTLPKSGGWLNTMKVTLGFIELALSLKFLSVADLAYGWHILDRETFLALWIAIFTCLGLYMLRIIRFYGDSDKNAIGAGRLICAVVSLSFAVYLVPGLWGAPLKSVSAFTPPLSTQDFNLYDEGKFLKFEDFETGMDKSGEVGKPVFIDFSGYGCVNCRKMEASVFENQKVRQLLESDFVMITLMTDDKTELPQMIEMEENGKTVKLRTYGDYWSYLQEYKFHASSQPYYAVLDNEGNLISGPAYYDEDVNKFVNFLQTGINNYKKNESHKR